MREENIVKTLSLCLVIFICLVTRAQTFQAPTDNTYTCFSGEDFITTTNQIGTLLIAAETYTFTLGTQSETGILTTQNEPVTDTFNFATAGATLVLKSQQGNKNIGFYLEDATGGSYLIIIATGDTFIRCDAPGSNFAAAASGKSTATTTTTGEGSLLAPASLPNVVTGTYQCLSQADYSYDELDDKEPVEETSVQLFDTGEFKDNDPNYSFQETGRYVFDGQALQFPDAGGTIDQSKVFKYGAVNGTPTFVWSEQDSSSQEILACTRVSDVTDAPPSLAASEDYNLEPDLRAPAPPALSGGLSGLFVNTRFESDTIYITDANGYPIPQPSTNQIDTKLFFFPDGYVFEGNYEWGYSELDCSRVYKQTSPQAEGGTAICGTYSVQGESMTIVSRDASSTTYERFFQEDGGIQLDNDFYFARKPVPDGFRLNGAHSTQLFTGANNVSTIISFSPDGTFVDDSSSTYISGSTGIFSDCSGSVGGTTTTTPTGNGGSSTTTVTTETLGVCNNTGTYTINGYTLTLTYSGGRISSLFLSQEGDDIYINQEIFSENE